MACCTSLGHNGTKLIGDPLDLIFYDASGFTFEQDTFTRQGQQI